MTTIECRVTTSDAGTVISARGFPHVGITNGRVRIDDYEVSAEDAIQWARLVAEHVERREDAR